MSNEQKANKPSFFGHLQTIIRRRLIAGVLVVVPLWLTYIALKYIFLTLDGFFAPIIKHSFGISIPGLGFILLLAFLYLIGMVTANIIGRSFVHFWESVLDRIPIVKNIYQAAKQLIHTVSISKSMGFKRVVLVEYPRIGIYAVAFVTNSTENKTNGKRFTIVFIPTTPNPTSGVFEIVPDEDIIETKLTVEEGVKMVISGGLITSPNLSVQSEKAKPS